MVHTKSGRYISSQEYLAQRVGPSAISPQMARSVSQFRRDGLEEEMVDGKFRDDGTGNIYRTADHLGPSPAGFVTSSAKGFSKLASGVGTTAGSGGFRGSGGTLRQSPDIYSPLWLNSNLNLPRDRATINAWSRAFFALNPLVQNAISLHSTYPISKLNIKCKSEKVQDFFENMNEEIDLRNICTQIAQEFWILGECFPYAELDERSAKWSRVSIQNPDYVMVKNSVIAGEPIISLRPDENLKRIVTSNRPADVQQRQKL